MATPKLVLLHALPLDPRMWEPQLNGLGGLDVVAPRLYGRGNTMDAWAQSLLAEIPGDLILVGASMGGYCALAMARREPERVLGIVLAGSRPDADTPERRAGRADTIAKIEAGGAEGMWEAMKDRLFRKDSDEDVVERARAIALEQKPEHLRQAMEAVRDREDNTELAKSYGDRLLMIVGDDDPFVSVEEARAFSTGAEAIFLETGHLPSLEQPERFNHVVADFAARWT